MKRFFLVSKVLVLLTFIFAIVALVGCDKPDDGNDPVIPTLGFESVTVVLEEGETYELKPSADIEGEVKVTYTLSKDGIISIEGNIITALAEGEVKVEAALTDYADAAKVEINVTVNKKQQVEPEKKLVESITIDMIDEVEKGEKQPLEATVLPKDADNKEIEWSVSDESILKIEGDILVAVGVGTAKVIATSKDGSGVKAEFEVKVTMSYLDVTGTITISCDKEFALVGETAQLTATVETNAEDKSVVWSVIGVKASVDENGVVTFADGGDIEIVATLKASPNVRSSIVIPCKLIIESIEVTAEKTTYQIGDTEKLGITFNPVKAKDDVIWTSSNEAAVTVDAEGNITAVGAGTATITATCKYQPSVSASVEVTVSELQADLTDIYVDASFTGYEAAAAITINDKIYYYGLTAFNNLSEALAVATGKVTVAAGTYEGASSVVNSNVTILGPNANVNPVIGVRGDEAVIKGVLTVNAGVENVVINGLAFTEGGSIYSKGFVKDITVKCNYAYDTNEDTAAYLFANGASAVFGFYGESNTNLSKNLKFENNKFSNASAANILVYRVNGFVATGNGFYNFDKDGIRIEGGLNDGECTIENNEFINDEVGGYNGIYFKSYSGTSGGDIHTISIKNNKFSKIGQAEVTTYSGAISFTSYQEAGAKVDILCNTFEYCTNYIHLRNNGAVAESWSGNINYNYFKGTPISYYHLNKNGTSDTDLSNPSLANMDFNYFEDDNGVTITDLSGYADKFANLASYKDNYQDKPSYEAALKGLLGIAVDYYVSSELAGKEPGTVAVYSGLSFMVGQNAFADLDEALAVAMDNQVIYVAAGTYSKADSYKITQNGLKIVGPNETVDPNMDNRNPEAVFTEVINIEANVCDVTIAGLCFTGNARIVGSDEGGIKNLTIDYIVFDSQIANGDASKGCIHLSALLTAGNENLTVTNSRFESTGKRTVPLYLGGLTGLVVKNNYFQGSPGSYNDTIKCCDLGDGYEMSGMQHYENNQFINTAQYTIWYLAPGIKDGSLNVIGNNFEGCGDYDAAYFRAVVTCNQFTMSEGYKTVVNFEKNTLTDSYAALRLVYGEAASADNFECTVKDNVFNSWRQEKLITNNSNATAAAHGICLINAEYNYFKGGAKEALFNGVTSFANEYATAEEVPAYVRADAVNPESLEITNKIEELAAYTSHQLTFVVGPSNATNKKVIFKSSDTTVATVSSAGLIVAGSEGTVTITATCVANGELIDSFTFRVVPVTRLEPTYDGNGVLIAGEDLKIDVEFVENTQNETISFSSSDESIATVDENGIVTAKDSGVVTITITSSVTGLTSTVSLTCYNQDDYDDLSDLSKFFIENNSGVVINKDIVYIGSDDGSADYLHNIYGAVNNYWFGEAPKVTMNMLPSDRPNYSGIVMKKVEFITIHDTAGSGSTSTAKANSNWCTSTGNTATSWHYTIGNDGIYQSLPENIAGKHAGDGLTNQVEFTDTGVKATVLRPEASLGTDGYVYLNGEKTTVMYPSGANKIALNGLTVVTGENGNYYLPTLHVCFQGPSGQLCTYGGNLSSIGIETAVNLGSDVYLTWQYVAKYCAEILMRNELTPDRVRFHNSFDGKLCPRTMMTAGLIDQFLAMVDAEYAVANDYSDYSFSFTSLNPDIIDNTGRVISSPEYTANVQYELQIATPDGEIETIILNGLVLGQYNI